MCQRTFRHRALAKVLAHRELTAPRRHRLETAGVRPYVRKSQVAKSLGLLSAAIDAARFGIIGPNYHTRAGADDRANSENVPTMTNIRSFASLPVAAVAVLVLLVSALTFAPPPQILEANSPPSRPTGLNATAQDDTILLKWEQAGNVDRYEYQVNHNNTKTGKLTGWSAWADLVGSSQTNTSYTFTNLAKGKEYRYKIRAVEGQGQDALYSNPAPADAPWYVGAVIEPPAPTGLTATAGVSSVTLSWDDPGDSTISYEYRWRTHPGYGWAEWAAISNPTSAAGKLSHTFTGLTAGKEYRYKIRAVNSSGGSKPAPAAAPWYVAVTPFLQPVDNLWVVRVCDHLFKVRWERVSGATGYDLNMSLTNGKTWQRVMTNKNYNAWQLSQWTKNKTFWFAVRAVYANGTSPWRSVQSIAPPCAVEGLQASYAANGQMTASWQPAKRATGYDVNFSSDNGRSWQEMVSNTTATSASFTKDPAALPYNLNFLVAVQSRKGKVTGGWSNAPIVGLTAGSVAGTTATLNLWNHSGNWYYKASEPPDDALCNGPVSGADKDLTGLHPGTDYQYTADSDGSCTDTISSVTFATPATLTVSNVTVDGATLNLDGHDLQWWYDADTGPHTTCQGPVAAATSTADLTGLTVNQPYTYQAYSAAGCNDGDLLASATFTPTGVSVSNLDETLGGDFDIHTVSVAAGFTTGSNSGGYTLQSVTVKIANVLGSPNATAAIYAESGGDPASSATYTLTGPTTPQGNADNTWSCAVTADVSCSLDADTDYFLVLSAANGSFSNSYAVTYTASDDETNAPDDAGWSIADLFKYGPNPWDDDSLSDTIQFKVNAALK